VKYFEFKNTDDNKKDIVCAIGYPIEYFCNAILNAQLGRGEFVSTAAVRLQDGQVAIVTRPGKHEDILLFINYCNLPICETNGIGFLTTAGRYVDKESALELAVKSKQLVDRDHDSRELECGDLW